MINRQDTGNTFKSIQTECLRLRVCNCLLYSGLQYSPPLGWRTMNLCYSALLPGIITVQ